MRLSSSDWTNNDLRLSLFYMTESQKKLAMTTPLPNVPHGYYYDEVGIFFRSLKIIMKYVSD